MVGPIYQLDVNVDNRKAGDHAVVQCFTHSCLNGANVFAGDRATDDLIDEFNPRSAFQRRDCQPDMPELAATACLANESTFGANRLRYGLAVCDLWATDICINLELTHHSVDDDFKVKLAHPRDDRLSCFHIRAHPERWVFLSEPTNRSAHAILVCLSFRL